MFDPSSFVNPTPLAHADASRDVLPRGEDGWKKKTTLREANDAVVDRTLYLWFSQRKKQKGPNIGPYVVRKGSGTKREIRRFG
ncbi:hypothetical protein TNCV_916391 [Trichonephila clavipes]|nr:hypothetical protein TNCV_916391 [Trichonephila clavipes]